STSAFRLHCFNEGRSKSSTLMRHGEGGLRTPNPACEHLNFIECASESHRVFSTIVPFLEHRNECGMTIFVTRPVASAITGGVAEKKHAGVQSPFVDIKFE